MGADLNEVFTNALEALSESVRDARAAGAGGRPRDIRQWREDPDVVATLAEGRSFLLVLLLMESGRSVKTNISLDRGLLEAIDQSAKRIGLTRSSFLASAARDNIAALV